MAPDVVEREAMVEPARVVLRRASATAAIALHRDRLPEAEVRALLAEQGLYTDERIERTMRIISDPWEGGFELTYVAGARLIREWLAVQGQTSGFARLLAEQLTPDLLRADLGEPPPLFPGSLV
jgi:hypothetical protein